METPLYHHPQLLEELQQRISHSFAGHIGIEVVDAGEGFVQLQMAIQPYHLAPNGYLHGGSVVALGDTACGFGCTIHLPPGANNFTTVELKNNFIRTATEGTIHCHSQLLHGGRSTQVWDATVTDDVGRTMALCRCTQMILYP